MNKARKIFWGVLFVLGAATVIAWKLGYLGELGIWTVLLSVALLGVFVDGIFMRSFGMMSFSVAFFIIVNDTLLGLEAITPWPVLIAALLLTIGLSILFPHHGKWHKYANHVCNHHDRHGCESDSSDNLNGENVNYQICFGEAVKYITSQELSQVSLECSFGSLVVYFDNAVLKDGTATVHVANSFGSTVLYVPSDWKTIHKTKNAFGGTTEKGHGNPNATNILNIYGDISFGALEIHYI